MNPATRICIVLALTMTGLVACDDTSDGDGQDTATDTTAPDVEDDLTDVETDPSLDVEEEDVVLDVPADVEPDAPGPDCSMLAEGWVEGFMVDGLARDFILHLPTDVDTGGPWPVIFAWHGLGDTADDFDAALALDPDEAVLPHIQVVPEGTDNPILGGLANLDWEVAEVSEGNREARLVDEVLACIEERWGVDEDHIHSMGISLGGFATDAVMTMRGDVIASAFTWSGAYGNDAANLDAVEELQAIVFWDDLDLTNKYPQVLVHGGETDTYTLLVITIPFDQMATNDAAFLNDNGHDVILCDHGLGHTMPGSLGPLHALQFFADHPMGTTDLPWETDGMPAAWPDDCTLMPAP